MKNLKKSSMEVKNDTSYGIVGKRISIDLSAIFAILQMQEKLMKLSEEVEKSSSLIISGGSELKEKAIIIQEIFVFLDKLTEGVSTPSNVYQELTTRPDDNANDSLRTTLEER